MVSLPPRHWREIVHRVYRRGHVCRSAGSETSGHGSFGPLMPRWGLMGDVVLDIRWLNRHDPRMHHTFVAGRSTRVHRRKARVAAAVLTVAALLAGCTSSGGRSDGDGPGGTGEGA